MNVAYKLLALLLVLVAVGAMGHRAGRHAAESEQAERNLVAARQYAEALTKAQTDARAAEQRSAQLLANAASTYQASLKEHDDAAQKTIANLRSGRISLRVPACPAAPSGGAVSSAVATTSGRDGETQSDVLARLAEDVAQRLARCDAIVLQLTAAQAVIEADRK